MSDEKKDLCEHMREEKRQMVLLALAELALSRPGWNQSLTEMAKDYRGLEMFEDFKRINADRVHDTHESMLPPGEPPFHFRLWYEKQGGHTHVRMFGGKGKDFTHGKNGDLTFENQEWEFFKSVLPEDIFEIREEGDLL